MICIHFLRKQSDVVDRMMTTTTTMTIMTTTMMMMTVITLMTTMMTMTTTYTMMMMVMVMVTTTTTYTMMMMMLLLVLPDCWPLPNLLPPHLPTQPEQRRLLRRQQPCRQGRQPQQEGLFQMNPAAIGCFVVVVKCRRHRHWLTSD